MRRKRICSLFVCLLLILGLAGCRADISDYEDQQILIKGLLEEDFYITPGELAELECVEQTTRGNTKKAGTVTAYGPTMETFLSVYDKSLDEFYSIKFSAEDDYSVTLGRQTFENYEIIMSVANGSEPLYEKQWPLRIVIPNVNSGKWIYMVTEIEFTYKE